MSVPFNVWFSYEDEEAELHEISWDTSISTLRKKLHEGKIFGFPEGVTQTDLQIGKLIGDKFEKFKPRNNLEEIGVTPEDTLYVRLKKAKAQNLTRTTAQAPTQNLAILQGTERAIKWQYDPYTITAEWTQTAVLVRIEQVPFAEGTFRQAYHLLDLGLPPLQNKFVAKICKKPPARAIYFEDVKMQMIARKWADKYNALNPPKNIEFLMSYVLELVDRQPDPVLCNSEPYVEGVYRKYNNNSGFVSTDERNTPQAFSHLTYEHSNHQILIVDIQGVGDHYTDPQIHTYDGVGFGQGNLGKEGFEKFLNTHQCNAVCQYLNLQPINPKSIKNDCGTTPRPDLDLSTMDTPQLSSSNGGPIKDSPPPSDRVHTGNTPREIPGGQSADSYDKEIEREKMEKRRSITLGVFKPWDMDTVKCADTLKGHHDMVAALCVVDNTLYSGGADTTIKVWDIKTLDCLTTLKGHEGGVECLVSNNEMLFSGSMDNTIKVWELKRHRCVYTLEGHDKPVHVLCINDKYLFSGSADKTIKVWDLKTLECKYTLDEHSRAVKALCVSGQYLFSGSNDKTIKVWDLKSFRCSYTLRGHTKWVKALCIWGTSLFSGSYDKTIRVWSLRNLECQSTLRGHERWVENMYIADKYLFTASDDNTVRIWDLESLKCIVTLEGHNGTVQCLVVNEGKRMLFSGSHDTTIKVWSWE